MIIDWLTFLAQKPLFKEVAEVYIFSEERSVVGNMFKDREASI